MAEHLPVLKKGTKVCLDFSPNHTATVVDVIAYGDITKGRCLGEIYAKMHGAFGYSKAGDIVRFSVGELTPVAARRINSYGQYRLDAFTMRANKWRNFRNPSLASEATYPIRGNAYCKITQVDLADIKLVEYIGVEYNT